MPLVVSIAALMKGTVTLEQEVSSEELGMATLDPCMGARQPFRVVLTAEMMGQEVFVDGRIEATFECRCVRCLEPFEYEFRLDPWQCLLALEGEEAAPVVNEAVDLTPQIREDSLLALPQHPVCGPDCRGLPGQTTGASQSEGATGKTPRAASAWSILDTLKLD